jgi:hypothetical protein
MTVYVDADHTHDLVTRISITGLIIYLLDGYLSVISPWRYQLMAWD